MKRILNIDHLSKLKKYKLWWDRERLICKFDRYSYGYDEGKMARFVTLDHRAYGLFNRNLKQSGRYV